MPKCFQCLYLYSRQHITYHERFSSAAWSWLPDSWNNPLSVLKEGEESKLYLTFKGKGKDLQENRVEVCIHPTFNFSAHDTWYPPCAQSFCGSPLFLMILASDLWLKRSGRLLLLIDVQFWFYLFISELSTVLSGGTWAQKSQRTALLLPIRYSPFSILSLPSALHFMYAKQLI